MSDNPIASSILSVVGKKNWQAFLLVCAVLVFPLLTKTFLPVRIGIIVAIYVMGVTGMTLIARYAGIVSLGHASFFAIGAYISALLTVKGGVNPWLSMIIAAAAAGAFAYVFSIPFLKLRRSYLAMATLGLGETVYLLVKELTDITGGVNGIPGIPHLSIGSYILQEDWQIFYLAWGFAVFLVYFSSNIGNSWLGRGLHAIRTNETAAKAMGIDVQRELSKVFCFSGIVTALSGSMLAHFITFISPESFTLHFSITLLILVVIGGADVRGGVLTAIILISLSELFRSFQDLGNGLYGFILIVALFSFPEGFAYLLARITPRNMSSNVKEQTLSHKPQASLPKEKKIQSYGNGDQILTLTNISKKFGGTEALSAVSATVHRGNILGIIGPNGAGKTTLLNVINGFHKPSEGQVVFAGQDITGRPVHQVASLGLGRTFQLSNLFKGMTVLENAMVGCHIKARTGMTLTGLNIPSAKREENHIRESTREMLQFLGMAERAYERVENLPYGEQKMVELARALVLEPTLLLLDEPASGLSSHEIEAFSRTLFRIKEKGITIIIVEHNVPLIMSVSDVVLVLDFGRKIAFGSPGEVSTNEEVIKAYLGRKTGNA
jgi:branched-chain amino acid transport system permease protein